VLASGWSPVSSLNDQSIVTGRDAHPIIKLKHVQTLNADRTRPVKHRPRPVQRPVTSVTTVRLCFFSNFWRSGK
jgi:hypothetical protein